MTHAISKRFWSRNKTLASLCLAIVCVVALLPLLAVNSYAAEPSIPPESLVPVPEVPDTHYPTGLALVTPQWSVETPVGTYFTPIYGSVTPYITSMNTSSSSRTSLHSVSQYNIDGTPRQENTAFIFRNVNDDTPALFEIYSNYIVPLADTTYPHAVTDTYFTFSTTKPDIEFSMNCFDISTGDIFDLGMSFTVSRDVPVYLSDLVASALSSLSPEHNPDECFVSSFSISFDSSYFSCDYPSNSYVKIITRRVTPWYEIQSLIETSNLLQRRQAVDSYNYALRFNAGLESGYEYGYRNGYVNGMNNAETKQFNPGWFVQGVDAFLNLRLFQFTVGNSLVDFTLGTILSITLGGTALIWFLKLFAGG